MCVAPEPGSQRPLLIAHRLRACGTLVMLGFRCEQSFKGGTGQLARIPWMVGPNLRVTNIPVRSREKGHDKNAKQHPKRAAVVFRKRLHRVNRRFNACPIRPCHSPAPFALQATTEELSLLTLTPQSCNDIESTLRFGVRLNLTGKRNFPD